MKLTQNTVFCIKVIAAVLGTLSLLGLYVFPPEYDVNHYGQKLSYAIFSDSAKIITPYEDGIIVVSKSRYAHFEPQPLFFKRDQLSAGPVTQPTLGLTGANSTDQLICYLPLSSAFSKDLKYTDKIQTVEHITGAKNAYLLVVVGLAIVALLLPIVTLSFELRLRGVKLQKLSRTI